MKRITRWSPDTCGCIIDYEWDDDVPEGTRVHYFKVLVSKCPEHPIVDGEAVYLAVLSENTKKNKVFGLAKGLVSDLTSDEYEWSFDSKRDLEVKIKMTGSQETQLQLLVNNEFGAGKVKVIAKAEAL